MAQFRPKKIGGDLKEWLVKRITESPKPKKTYIDLTPSLAQKQFAVYFGGKDVNKVISRRKKRLNRRIDRAAKPRLRAKLVHPEAVEKIKQKKGQLLQERVLKRAETTVGQDLEKVKKDIGASIVNSPQVIKEGAAKAGAAARNVYENTGDVVAKTAGWARKNPEIAIAQIPSTASRGIGFALAASGNIGGATLMQSIPVTPEVVGGIKLLRNPNALVKRHGKQMPRYRKDTLEGKEIERRVSAKIGGKSIKGGVEKVKDAARSVLTPIELNYTPTYQLRRVTA